MVHRYHRLPAALVLAMGIVLGGLYLRTWGRQTAEPDALQKAEALIASGKAGVADWQNYAELLAKQASPDYAAAAEAYRQVLDREHFNRPARQGRAICLAQAGKADELYAFLKELVISEPKLAVDLFERRELQKYASEERFATLNRDAKAQAMD